MTKNQLNTYLCAVLTTLLETEGHWSPCTPIYMALGCDMGVFMLVKQTLHTAKLATCTPETITLTDKGVDMAKEIEKALAKAKKLTTPHPPERRLPRWKP